MTTITRYSFETDQNETYAQVFQRALYPVKGEKIYITAERYKRLSDGAFLSLLMTLTAILTKRFNVIVSTITC